MKKIFYAALMVLLLTGLFACKSNNQTSKEADMSNGNLEKIIIAHRGASARLSSRAYSCIKSISLSNGCAILRAGFSYDKR